MTPPDFFERYRAQLDPALEQVLSSVAPPESRLYEAMHHSLLMGGKRVRPMLCLASAHAFGVDAKTAMSVACATELIHAYSLVHDDLPAMDDDDLRRGKPTCHIAFDEATAILAGDALQTAAFELLSGNELLVNSNTKLEMIQLLAQASGAKGMVLGQAIDLASVGRTLTLTELEQMHRLKTGRLIEASVLLGALSGSASEHEIASLSAYASALGLAFQVKDDILDVTTDTDSLGKLAGADAALNKPTYVSILGLPKAQEKLSELYAQCTSSLDALNGRETNELRLIADYVVHRGH